MPRQILMGLVILCCWFSAGATARAQQYSMLDSKPGSAPTPIPIPEIASQADSTFRSVQSIETTLSTDQITATIERRLPALTSEIELRGTEMAKFLGGIVPLELLHNMDLVLQTYRNQLSSWNDDLTERSKILNGQIAQLNRLNGIWKSTLQLPELSKAAPEMPERIKSLIDLISRTEQTAESRTEKVLALQGHLLESTARLQTVTPAFEQAQTNAVKNLFIQDSPALWNLGVEQWKKVRQAPLIPPASAALLKAYIRRKPIIFLIHAGIILVLCLSLYSLRRVVHKLAKEEPTLRRAARVFDLPVSTAVILSFLLFGSIYSMAPFLLRAILWGVLLIFIAFILRRLIDPALYSLVYALIVLYFIDRFRLLTALLTPLGRIVFTVEMLGGTLFLIWLIWSKRSVKVGPNGSELFGRVVRLAIQASLIVFPVTLLANVFGYINFANLLGGGAIRSAYVGAAAYATLMLVEGLIIISLRTRPLCAMRVVQFNRSMIQRRICVIAGLLAFLYWAGLTLNFFELLQPLITNTEAVLRANLAIGSLSISLQQVLIFLVTVWAAFAISEFLRFLLDEDIYYHWHLARGIPQAISTIVHYAILLIGFFIGLAVLGVDLTKVTILAGAFTVGVGFGLQTVINNFVCGLILLFERPIKVGDIVQIDSDIGEVRRIGIRACVIRTTDASEVIVPNGTIISNKVTNWTLSDRYRAIDVTVTVARGVVAQHVIEILKHVAANQAGIIKDPAPQAYVVSFSSGIVSFNVRAWTERYEDWMQARSDLSVAIEEALIRENIPVA
ncbi:MAG TPA: mechanosensitive ion channel domain-containing protein [Chthoniobacterales bacterium]|nr:mechanosensitive ion channel domain-containing protein [Chthoniobacterales bacterium]